MPVYFLLDLFMDLPRLPPFFMDLRFMDLPPFLWDLDLDLPPVRLAGESAG